MLNEETKSVDALDLLEHKMLIAGVASVACCLYEKRYISRIFIIFFQFIVAQRMHARIQ